MGADADATTRTNATNKVARIGAKHYTNAEKDILLMQGVSYSGTTSLTIGGGTSAMNTATSIGFYTSADNTTVTGTSRMNIAADGSTTIGSNVAGSLTVGAGGDQGGFTTNFLGGTEMYALAVDR